MLYETCRRIYNKHMLKIVLSLAGVLHDLVFL